jgi:hypothetical protein
MGTILNGDQQARLGGKLAEISRQVFLQKEYGFNPERLDVFLQQAIEGRFYGGLKFARDVDGVIRFALVSNGFTGDQWIKNFKVKGFPPHTYVERVFQHQDFVPTPAGTVHNIAVLPGKLYSCNGRITKDIRADAKRRKMTDPHPEVACLIREMFSNQDIKEMGLGWIITMHEPIPDFVGNPRVLGTCAGVYELNIYSGNPDDRWIHQYGFAFSDS